MDPIEQLYGHVVAMTRRSEGANVTTAASIAATVIHVDSTGDFDTDNFGQVVVGAEDDVYDYVAVDDDAATITLGSGLTTALAVDDRVDIYDPEADGRIVEYVAMVLLDESDRADAPIEVNVQHGLVNLLAESVRGGATEAVTLVRDGADDFMIWQIDGKLVVDLVVEELGTEVGTIGDTLADLNADLDYLNTVTLPGVAADLATLDGLFPITSTSISDDAITTPKLAANSVVASKIVALTITGDKIAANTISADKIVANSIGADKIAANAVTADKIAADAISGKTITGSTFQSWASGATSAGVSVNSSGISFYSGGSLQAAISNTGGAALSTVGIDSLGMYGNIDMNSHSINEVGALNNSGFSITMNAQIEPNSIDTGRIDATAVHASAGLFDDSVGTANPAKFNSSGRVVPDTSSARYKTDIQPAAVDTAAMRRVEIVTYLHQDGGGRVELGGIAEQVAEQGLEHLVIRDADGRPDAIDRAAFTFAVLALAQEQAARLDTQAAQIADLTARIDALEA